MSESPSRWSGIGREIVAYLAAALASLGFVAWVLRLWEADWAVPFAYSGDANFTGAAVKTMLEQGWWTQPNPLLGAPGAMTLADYPMADGLHFAIMKLIGLFAPNYAAVINVFFVLTFPLTAVTVVFAMRWLGCDRWIAVLAGLLYSALPYHFVRGEAHLFLAAYYMLPIALVLILQAMAGPQAETTDRIVNGYRRLAASPWFVVVAAVLVGSSGVYYAFFTCFLLIVAGVYRALGERSVKAAGPALLALAGTVGGTALNLVPNVVFWASAGRNSEAVVRQVGAAEVYGLKLDQVFLPIVGHRFGPFASIADAYMRATESISPHHEAAPAPIGVLLSIALTVLLLWLLFGRFAAPTAVTVWWDRLAVLSGATLLLATVGGYGAMVNLVIPQIRAYGRFSVFLALFAVCGLALALGGWIRRLRPRSAGYVLAVAGAVALVALSVLDMTSPRFVPAYAQNRAAFASDAEFVRSIEETLGQDAAVFQLPYSTFPEGGPVVDMIDYEQFKGYLHSSSLRWSYGAVKGRSDSEWQKRVAALPVEEQVRQLRSAGFAGVVLNGAGYADYGLGTASEFERVEGLAATRNAAGTLVFLDLRQ